MKLFSSVLGYFTKQEEVEPSLPTAETLAAAEAAKAQGNAFFSVNDFPHAAECYEQALRILPSYAEAHVNLGMALTNQNRLSEAEQHLVTAVALKPSLWQAHMNLGIVLQEQERTEQALVSFQQAITLNPENAECNVRLGNALILAQQHGQAIDPLKRALASNPRLPETQCNLGLALLKTNQYDEALRQFQLTLSMDENAVVHNLMGMVYEKLNNQQLAIESYRRAIALDPDFARGHLNLAFHVLASGDYEHGLAHYERRLEIPDKEVWLDPIKKITAAFDQQRQWKGQNIRGARLLLITEQGLGDSLMMLRYLPLLKNTIGVSSLSILCNASLPLETMFRHIPAVDTVFLNPDEVHNTDFDWYCTTMSLPFLFGTRLDTIPATPSLQIPARLCDNWRDRLQDLPGIKVGITWGGNAQNELDAIRSVPLNRLEPLFAVAGVTWISLQKGDSSRQLENTKWQGHDWMDECQTMQDTAALVANLDLVITVDTAIAHLAGVMGRPTWLLNRHKSEWRWLAEGDSSAWYPEMRIFRQPAAFDWDSVIGRVTQELQEQIQH